MSVPPHLPPEANAASQVDGDVPKDELCESDAESVDDKACDVCGGTEDKALFLLCDGNGGDCPGACHTFCDGLGNTVPDGDWFCRRCRASAPSAPEPLRHLACQQGQVKAQDVSRTHARPARLPQPTQDNDVEIVAEKGMRGPAADVPAGSQVFRHYRILRNAAAGWQVLGRLEMDRHKGQQTSRAPRWRYVHPDGQTSFVSINKQKSRSNSTSVESSGISVEGFEHLKKVQKSLMAVLCRRRDELVQVGSLIDERVEADWQQILMQRGGNSVRVQELRRNYASKVEKAPSAPEWRPPRWEASEAQCPPSLRRPGCIPTTSEGFVSSRKRGPDFSAAESALRPGPRPLRRYHDPFLRYIMSNAPQAPASEVDPDAGAEPDADAEPDALAEPEQEGNGRKQPRVGDRLAAGCEDAGEHQDAEQREARRRQSVSVQRLVKDPLAAERELKLHAGRTPWGRLLQLQGGQLGEGEGYDGDEFKEELKDEPMGAEGAEKPQPHEELARLFATEPDLQEVAWRCLIAATALGRATDQLPFVCMDLLRADACMRGGSAVKHFVRVLSVRDAMLAAEARLPKDLAVAADAPDMASFVTTVLRHFATCPPEENIDEASEALNCRFAGLRQFMADFRSDRRAAPYKALALKSQAYDKLGQLCAFTILLYSPLQATIQASKREAGKWSGNDAVARLLKQPCKWPLRRQGIAVLLGSFLSAVDRTGLTILMDLLESPSEWPTSDEDVRWGIARWELWVTLMQVIGRLAVELSGKPVEAPACFRIPAWWLGSSTTPRALEAVLEAWRDLLDALPKLTNGKDALPRILAATASSPAPRELAAELLQGLQGTRSSPAEAWALTRLLEVWEQEARALLPLASPSSGFEAVAAEWVLRASLCFEALCSRARCAARPLRPGARSLLEAAGEACAAGMALLVRTGNAAAVEKLVSFLPSSGESGRHRWHVPTESAEQKSAFFRAAGDPSGPSFNVDNKLHRFNGCRFSEILESCAGPSGQTSAAALDLADTATVAGGCQAFVKWALEKHITREAAEATTQSATAAAIKASTKAGAAAKKASLNPEVNRFARWILEDVLNYCPPLLRLPRRRARELLVPLAPLDEELAGMAARAQAVCSSFFPPLLRHLAPDAQPDWLRPFAVASCLQAGLVSCAVEPDLGMAVRGAIGELLVALGVADVRVALAADVALAQAAALSGPLRAWVFAGLARDLHQLLLLVDGLEKPAAGVRAKALFRLAAVSARRIGGKWPTPPAFPVAMMPSFPLHFLVFNPMRDAFPPGADSSMAISGRILQCRPLASLLVYLAPPERGMHLSSFSGLELSVQAAASVPSHSLSAWAAALTGSDLEDFVRLREWRSQTYASLMEQGQFVTLRKLQAAVSSRMVAVHCAVELSRARLHTAGPSEQRVNSLVQALLRDLGESTFEKALLEHTSATREILAGHSPRVAEQAVWAMRHLLFRYIALKKLFSKVGRGWAEGLSSEVRRCLAHLHVWFRDAGLADEAPGLAEEVAHGLALAAASLPWPEVACPDLSADEVAPPADSADGCFRGGAWVPEGADGNVGQVQSAMLEAADESPLESLPELESEK
ncbi:unnamed protein product [Polarella glacialis]|uniref:PHD-type domain-containing protein n=1 Tax=Polarella glacialis TaxID=89957 RepID=A0A813E042_POLGL|nr:unnamed protein product [Polarella glacialis]